MGTTKEKNVRGDSKTCGAMDPSRASGRRHPLKSMTGITSPKRKRGEEIESDWRSGEAI